MRSKWTVVVVLAAALSACAPTNDATPKDTVGVSGSDRSIDPTGWTITTPAAGATNSVRVAFPEPVDPVLLDALGVLAPNGAPLPGDAVAGEDRRLWQFTPKGAWPEGQYQLTGFGRALMPFVVR